MKQDSGGVGVTAGSTAAAILIAVAMSFAIPVPVAATEAFTKDTGKPCGACHQSPKGGGKLTEYGERFRANGNKLPTRASNLRRPAARPTPRQGP